MYSLDFPPRHDSEDIQEGLHRPPPTLASLSTRHHRRLGRNPHPRLVPILHYLCHCEFQCSPQLDLVIVVYGLSKLPDGLLSVDSGNLNALEVSHGVSWRLSCKRINSK